MKSNQLKNITLSILEHLSEVSSDAFDAIFPRTYGHTKMTRDFFGVDRPKHTAKQKLSSALNKLKHQGLVVRVGKLRSVKWKITTEGKQYIKNLYLAVPEIPKQDGIMRLVIFDIPEKQRYKRDLIRAELVSYNFKMLQKSVWLGTNPLPEDFVDIIDGLDLKNRIHIFSVSQSGTIE